MDFYDCLLQENSMRFRLSAEQSKRFNAHFEQMQQRMYAVFKDDILASVRRLGLICFRIAMIISALRIKETGDLSQVF